MIRTVVGYAGGTKKKPTYGRMGDHTEVVRVVYDPEVTSYRKLLQVFWNHHNSTARQGKRQYWNAVFYHNPTQKQQAEQSLESLREKQDQGIRTKILPVRSFTRAEQYHQKYYLQRKDALVDYLRQHHPGMRAVLDSTTATRANAFVAGVIDEKQLKSRLNEAKESELPEEALDQVESMLCGGGKK